MATVTIYDGKTGTPIAGEGRAHPDPIVSADDHSKITFVFDPRGGRALVQFVADPGSRRLVAGLELAEDDGLPDVYRVIQERIAASNYSMAPPGRAPPHLNVFHYLAVPDPAMPDAEIRAHLVATDDPIEVGVPSAAEAASVVAFFRERAPWKVVAVHAAGATVSTADADVTVVVDGRFDEVTFAGRDASWSDEDARPNGSPGGDDAAAATADVGVPTNADSGAAATTDSGGAARADAGAATEADVGAATPATAASPTSGDSGPGETPDDEPPVLRIYDGATGQLEYDSRRAGDVPEVVNEDARRIHRDGLALFDDPDAGVLRAILRARGAGVDTRFVVEYERHEHDGNLPATFASELADRVDDLGVEFSVVVAGEEVDFDRFADAASRRPGAVTDEDRPEASTAPKGSTESDVPGTFQEVDPTEAFTDGDVEWLRKADRPLDFAAPGGVAAFDLAADLREHLGDGRSIAVCAAGRTDDLAATDAVVTPDPDCETIEPRGETATAIADRRLQEQFADVGATVEAMVGRIDEVTGTIEARQRVFAAALTGGTLARRGHTVVPVDDRPIGRRRRQARYLVLYGLLLAGLAGGAHTGRFDPLAALLSGTAQFVVGPVAGTPLETSQLTYAVDGDVVVGGSLLAMLAGAYWLFGHPLGPLAAARSLAGTVWWQVTGGVGSGTVPSTVRSLADPIRESLDDLEAAYERLADTEGTTAPPTDGFEAVLEQQLLARPVVPQVTLARRRTRWRQLLVGVATGVLVGAASAAAILGALWFAVQAVETDPALGMRALLGVAALVLLASIVKGIAVRYGRGRPPRWSTAR